MSSSAPFLTPLPATADATYDGCERSQQRRLEHDKKSYTDIGPRTSRVLRDRSFYGRCGDAHQAIARRHGCSPARCAHHPASAYANIRRFSRDRRMPEGCIEPSQVVALVSVRNDVVWDEFPAVGLCQPPAHCSVFIVTHGVDAGPPRLDFARVLGQLLLILLRPGLNLLKQPFSARAHINNIARSCPLHHPSLATRASGRLTTRTSCGGDNKVKTPARVRPDRTSQSPCL